MNIGFIFDIFAGCLLAFFLARGLMKGFSGEIIGLVGLIASSFAALSFMDTAADLIIQYLPQFSEHKSVISVVCAAIIFLGVSIGFSLLNALLSYIVKAAKLSFLDHVLGIFMGFLKTVCIILFIYGLLKIFASSMLTDFLEDSYVFRAADFVFPYVRDFLQDNGIIDFNVLVKG